MNMTQLQDIQGTLLDWRQAPDGSWFAPTGDVDGWLIVVGEMSISVIHNGAPVASTFRMYKQTNPALKQAEAFARFHVLKRFGALLVNIQ